MTSATQLKPVTAVTKLVRHLESAQLSIDDKLITPKQRLSALNSQECL